MLPSPNLQHACMLPRGSARPRGAWTKLLALLWCCAAIASTRAEDSQGASHKLEYEAEPIRYSEQTPTDPVAKLQHLLATGDAKLTFDDRFGYLPDLLEKLNIPRS